MACAAGCIGWRSVKYEEIHLFEYATVPALRTGLVKWFSRYLTPAVVYQTAQQSPQKAPEAATPEAALHCATLRCVLRLPLRLPKFEFSATPLLIHDP